MTERLTQEQKIMHYRVYLKIYGSLIMELADSESEILALINNDNPASLLRALKERIEDSPVYEIENGEGFTS